MPQSRGTFFISHSSKDRMLTTHFGRLLRSVSLNQIEPWFSSDSDHAGGIHPGESWFEKIREKMGSSSAIIALLTESSISSRWVFFESGFGAAVAGKKLILVTHGVGSMADIPEPLSRWQAFRIDKPENLREFCEKLLAIYDISFDVALFQAHSKTYFKETRTSKILDPAEPTVKSLTEESQRLMNHFDRRFFELTSQLNVKSPFISYTVVVESDFDGTVLNVEISESRSIQDVLDAIWDDLVHAHVDAYTYLEEWVLVHEKTKLKLIIREIAHSVPATAVFAPGSKWLAKKLVDPYKPSDSSAEIAAAGRKLSD